MFNPIEERRKFVQGQIEKSFNGGIDITDELEKAHKDGDHHPTKPWVWVSSANGGKGDWRVEGGRAHKKTGVSTTDGDSTKVDISKIPNAEFKQIIHLLEKKNPDNADAPRHLEEEAMTDSELANFYACAEHFKNSSKINKTTQEYCKKWAALAKQEMQYRKNEKMKRSDTPKPRKPGSTDEIERMTAAGVRSSILGLNNIGTNVKDKGDYFHIEFDANDFSTHGQRSPQIDRIAKFLEGMGASCVIGKNEIKAYKKVEAKKQAITKVDIDSEIKGSYEINNANDLAEDESQKTINKKIAKILGGSVDDLCIIDDEDGTHIDNNNWNTLLNDKPKSISKTIDLGSGKEDGDDFWYGEGQLVTTKGGNQIFCWHDSGGFAVKYVIKKNNSNGKSNSRDKIAQNAGFKDYAEMSGYQAYVTKKQLLKKPSMQARTKAEDRKKFEAEVAQYEKEHADVIAKIEGKNKTKSGNFKDMKLTEILDSLDNWGDKEWNDQSLNKKLSDAISAAIKSEKIDEKKFNEIAKKYQGLDLVYTDYADLDEATKIKRATSEFDKLFRPLDDWDDDDWNDKKKNAKLEGDIRFIIRNNRISEKQFKEIAKRYQGLDLVYTDFIPKSSSEYKKFN